MEPIENDVRLYILMRNDLPGGNPGKLCAQASHAANQMAYEARFIERDDFKFNELLYEWEDQTENGFGTCIVLGVSEEQLREKISSAKALGHHVGITHDPSYPTFSPRHPLVSFLHKAWLCAKCLYLIGSMLVSEDEETRTSLVKVNDRLKDVIAVDTCGYILGRSNDLFPIVGDLRLMK